MQYPIWNTVSTELRDDPEYSPTDPGTYTWPIAGETSFYSTLYAGPLPPIMCPDSIPAGTVYRGCYAGIAVVAVL